MGWLNGEDNWSDCMSCGDKFFANEYHPLCERCEARKRLGIKPINWKIANKPKEKKDDTFKEDE